MKKQQNIKRRLLDIIMRKWHIQWMYEGTMKSMETSSDVINQKEKKKSRTKYFLLI